jgi:hypothetical protein
VVAYFEMTYNAFLGRPSLTNYLVLKMAGPNKLISIKGDVKHACNCDRESCEMAEMYWHP